jgi:hypothetical protein
MLYWLKRFSLQTRIAHINRHGASLQLFDQILPFLACFASDLSAGGTSEADWSSEAFQMKLAMLQMMPEMMVQQLKPAGLTPDACLSAQKCADAKETPPSGLAVIGGNDATIAPGGKQAANSATLPSSPVSGSSSVLHPNKKEDKVTQ